jgi:hypothetical protein
MIVTVLIVRRSYRFQQQLKLFKHLAGARHWGYRKESLPHPIARPAKSGLKKPL